MDEEFFSFYSLFASSLVNLLSALIEEDTEHDVRLSLLVIKRVALAEKKMERVLPRKPLNMSNFVIAACKRAMDKND